MNCRYRKMLAPVVVLLLFAFFWKKAGIFFEMNDDKLITEILSGVQTGGPDAHAEFINYFLALPISMLYRISKGVPWYGLCLIFFQALAYIGILESLYSRCRNIVETMLGTLVTVALILAGLYPLCCIEFTSTAAILAAAGYFCLLVRAEGRGRWIWFFVLELLSCCLRTDAMLMMQPMGILTAWGVMSARGGSFSLRRCAAKAGCVLAVPIAVLLIMSLGDAIGYQGADWAEYRQFRADRSTVVDYGEGAPPYEEVKEILDRHQVTEADYEAFRNNVVLDWIISPACMKELAAYVDGHRVKMDVGGLLESLWRNKWVVYYWNMRNLRYVPAVLWLAVLLGITLSGQIYVWGGYLAFFVEKRYVWDICCTREGFRFASAYRCC